MIKVNLQNTDLKNRITGQNSLDSIFVENNNILFISKPEYLKQMHRDEIKAKQIKMNLEIVRQEIHRRMVDPRYSNFDDMETLTKFRKETEKYQETEREYRRLLGECENVKMIPVYSGMKMDVTTGEMTEVRQDEYADYAETEGNKVRLILDVLALDDEKLDRDSAWMKANGHNISISTTPAAPLAVKGGTLEEAVAALI